MSWDDVIAAMPAYQPTHECADCGATLPAAGSLKLHEARAHRCGTPWRATARPGAKLVNTVLAALVVGTFVVGVLALL